MKPMNSLIIAIDFDGTVREKLDELEFHLMTLQEDETIRRCRKLVREVIEEKFGGKCESDSDDSGDDAWRSA